MQRRRRAITRNIVARSLRQNPQSSANVAVLRVEGGVPMGRDITCDGSVMRETAQFSRCDGVMDRIASILTFSIRLRHPSPPGLRRTSCFRLRRRYGGQVGGQARRQTHSKRIPNAFRTDEMAGSCGNNGYNGLRNISNLCGAQKGLARHRKSGTLGSSRHLHWSLEP
jgi:hypothetical protein